jgi:hypothetical protein
MQFTATIKFQVSRTSGKFATRDEIAEYIQAELEGADFGEVDGVGADGDSVYTIDDWSVEV